MSLASSSLGPRNFRDKDDALPNLVALLEERGIIAQPLTYQVSRRHVHPIRYPHVWFNILTLVLAISTTSSLYPGAWMEYLVFSIIMCSLLSLVFALSQDVPLRNVQPLPKTPKPVAPSKVSQASQTLHRVFREAQIKAGIVPRD